MIKCKCFLRWPRTLIFTRYVLNYLHKLLLTKNTYFLIYVVEFLLIRSGIETNPGPSNLINQNLRIVHNNVCSLLLKLDVVSAELSDFDIIARSETHLDNSITDDDISLPGFHIPIRNDRNRFGGGVALYISKSLHFSVRRDLDSRYMEILWSEVIANNNNKLLIGVIYRPPNSKAEYWDNFLYNLQQALDLNIPILLLGDFNVNMLSNQSRQFKLLLQRLNLTNLINNATNFTTNTGTCIDLILTNNTSLIQNQYTTAPFCSSRSVISVEINFTVHKQYAYKRVVRNYENVNFHALNEELSQVDWNNTVFNSDNINEIYSNFISSLNNCIDNHIPKKPSPSDLEIKFS